MFEKKDVTRQIKMKSLELGFAKVGVTTADDFTDYEKTLMERPDYAPWVKTEEAHFIGLGARPRKFFPNGKSIICTAYGYGDIVFPEELSKYVSYGYLSRAYNPLKNSSCGIRVEAFKDFLKSLGCNIYEGEIHIPARIASARAGIITYGKNNFAYTDEFGSFIILYAFLIDMELEYDEPTVECKCPPNCEICIKSCPMKAILSPGRLQPIKCMLYFHKGKYLAKEDLRDSMGTYIQGCDICQKVCPRNKNVLKNASRKDPFLEALNKEFDIKKILLLDEKYYKDVIYPIMHNYITDLNLFRRNAAIAIGNTGDHSYISSLKKVLENENPQVREAAQWAINKLEGIQSDR